jgi:4-amino-4-deoxy-L-arabinose transferase-like glycosyltransferase
MNLGPNHTWHPTSHLVWLRLGLGLVALALAGIAQIWLDQRANLPVAGFLFVIAAVLFIIAFPPQNFAPTYPLPHWIIAGLLLLGGSGVAGFFLSELDFITRSLYVSLLGTMAAAFLGGWLVSERSAATAMVQRIVVAVPRLWRYRDDSRPALVITAGVVLSGAAGLVWAIGEWNTSPLANLGLVLWLAGLLAFGVGCWWGMANDRPGLGFQPRWSDWLTIAGLLAIAAVFRGYHLADVPYGSWYDEAESGLEALEILNGKAFSPAGLLTPFNPAMFFYLIAGSFQLFGVGILPIRLVVALAGIAAPPLLFLLLRQIWGWRAGAIGGVLLAVSAWHTNFSRFGLPNGLSLPFALLGCYLLARGYRSRSRRQFLLAGLCFGAGLYTHTAFRLILVVAGLLLLYWLASNRSFLLLYWSHLALLVAAVVIVSVPLVIYGVQNEEKINRRLSQTWIFAGKVTQQTKIEALQNGLIKHIAMFNYQGDPNGRHGLPGAPVVDGASGALLVIGLAYAGWNWRRWPYFFLLAWFGVGLSAGALTLDWEAPQAARTVIMIPAVYALAALPLALVWQAAQSAVGGAGQSERLTSRLASIWPLAPAIAIGVALVAVGASNFDRYFYQQMRSNEVWNAFSGPETAEARFIEQMGSGYRYYFGDPDAPIVRLITERLRHPGDYRLFNQYEHLPLRDDPGKNVMFLIEPWRINPSPEAFARYYPDAKIGTFRDLKGDPVFHNIAVPYQSVLAIQGLRGTYSHAPEPSIDRYDPTVDFDWARTPPPAALPCVAGWQGTIFISTAGTYTFGLETAGAGWLEIDGARVVSASGAGQSEQAIRLAKGPHHIRLVDTVTGASGRTALTWTLPNGYGQTVPRLVLGSVPLPDRGLRGRYYPNPLWEGDPVMVSIDENVQFRWHPAPLPGDWSVEWRGTLLALEAGYYEFDVATNERSWLRIDGQMLLDGASSGGNGRIRLSPGPHPIVVKYASTRGYAEMRLYWRPPGQSREPVPASALRPED